MEGMGAILESGANIVGSAAKVAGNTEKVIEAGAQVAKATTAGVKETASLTGPLSKGLQAGNLTTPEVFGDGMGIGAESLGALPTSPIGLVKDALKEAPIEPDLGPALSPGERAAEAYFSLKRKLKQPMWLFQEENFYITNHRIFPQR